MSAKLSLPIVPRNVRFSPLSKRHGDCKFPSERLCVKLVSKNIVSDCRKSMAVDTRGFWVLFCSILPEKQLLLIARRTEHTNASVRRAAAVSCSVGVDHPHFAMRLRARRRTHQLVVRVCATVSGEDHRCTLRNVRSSFGVPHRVARLTWTKISLNRRQLMPPITVITGWQTIRSRIQQK